MHLTVPESDRFFADESPEALADIFIVSKVELAIGDALAVNVDNAAGHKVPALLEALARGKRRGSLPPLRRGRQAPAPDRASVKTAAGGQMAARAMFFIRFHPTRMISERNPTHAL